MSFLFKKINKEAFLEISLLTAILLSAIFNLYLFEKKNNPEISLKEINIFETSDQKMFSQKTILKEKDVQDKLNYYQALDKNKIKNLGVFLNLSQLYEIKEAKKLSREYLDQAQKIEPKISY